MSAAARAPCCSSWSDVNYTGIDRNERYISEAQARHGSRGRFILADVGEVAGMGFPPFDIVTMFGLLHHLDDRQAAGLMAAVRPLLREGGRVVTVDPCFVDRQNPIAWLLARMDRGRNVRRADAYRALAAAAFPKVELHVRAIFCGCPTTTPSWSVRLEADEQMNSPNSRLRVAILISGRGSNMQALIEECARADSPADIALVISNKAEAGGLARARAAGIATDVVSHLTFADRAAFEAEIDAKLRAAGI